MALSVVTLSAIPDRSAVIAVYVLVYWMAAWAGYKVLTSPTAAPLLAAPSVRRSRVALPAEKTVTSDHDAVAQARLLLRRAQELSASYAALRADPKIAAEALISRPLILDLSVVQTRQLDNRMSEMIVEALGRSAEDLSGDPARMSRLNILITAAESAYSAADAHARAVGIPQATVAELRRGRFLVSVVLDDRTRRAEERARAWEALEKLIRSHGISPSVTDQVAISLRGSG